MDDDFATTTLPIRDDLRAALLKAWDELGQAGAWLDAGQRLAVAGEARQARTCALCRARKEALSPYAVSGAHEHLDLVPEPWVEVIHRVVTDPGRLSERWYRAALDAGVIEDELIEIISVTVITVTADAFALGLGLAPAALPQARSGRPARRHEPTAKRGPGWAQTVAPEDADAGFAEFYANESHFYIRRSLTLVPEETRRLWALLNTLYMQDPRVRELEGLSRGISRAQIEFLAARASALLGCYY